MKFGHADFEQLSDLTFTLPKDHELSEAKSLEPTPKLEIYTGCGKWGIKEWVGTVYPEKTRQKDFLLAYLDTFGSIELNGTFYRLSRSSIEKWKEAAQGREFQFCPKWSQRISHFKRLNEVEENVQYFMDSVAELGPNLGQTFLTLPPNFGVKHMQRVKDFVELIPIGYPLQMEFRHPEWFTEPHFSELTATLKARKLGMVITDVALRRDALHMCLTNPIAFIRFNGYGLHDSDYQRLDAWVKRISRWKQTGIEKVYFFMHQQDEQHTPVLCSYFAAQIEEKCELKLQAPILSGG